MAKAKRINKFLLKYKFTREECRAFKGTCCPANAIWSLSFEDGDTLSGDAYLVNKVKRDNPGIEFKTGDVVANEVPNADDPVVTAVVELFREKQPVGDKAPKVDLCVVEVDGERVRPSADQRNAAWVIYLNSAE